MSIRTVFIDTSLPEYEILVTKYDVSAFNIILLADQLTGYLQIQDYLTANSLSAADINVVSASASLNGVFTPRVVFIDPSVAEYQTLIADMPANATIVVLNASLDGVQQIQDYLTNNTGLVGAIDIITNIDSLDVVSHGTSGEITLGSTVLNSDTMASYAAQLAEIGSHLTSTGDILLYGCDVVADATGQQFIDQLALATGADVAASTDLTGNAAIGGDWVLEANTGTIETAAIQVEEYTDILSATVNLNGTTGFGSTDYTEQTTILLFPVATFTAVAADNNKVDIITVTLANPSATMTLGLNAAATGTASTNGITSAYANGVLTLTGLDENNITWMSILRGITYNDTSDAPTNPGTIRASALNAGVEVGFDTHVIAITSVNDAPAATNLSAAESYTKNTPLNLTDIVVTDVDGANVYGRAQLTLSDTAAGSLMNRPGFPGDIFS
jgi:hypothetical protein